MVPECKGIIYEDLPSKEKLWDNWCARTTEAVRRTIQNSQESIAKLSQRYNLNPKTIVKWKKRSFAKGVNIGPKHPRSTVLTKEEEAIIVAFRKHTLLPLDDCLYALYQFSLLGGQIGDIAELFNCGVGKRSNKFAQSAFKQSNCIIYFIAQNVLFYI